MGKVLRPPRPKTCDINQSHWECHFDKLLWSQQKSVVGYGLARTLRHRNSGVARSMVTEITDETNRAAAFSIVSFCWGIGLIGGYLCKPTEHFPGLFGNIQFLKDFPYFLPCLVSAVGSFCGFLLGYCYLKETNVAVIRRQQKSILDERTALLVDDITGHEEDDLPAMKGSSSISHITKASYAVIVGYA
ncbi:hypothetical protein DFQ28_010515 [Apophysomyces sp. BC1034]|nr:hypothetical protein DFQ28_010515 [Apophysomyces sp. BC1034]